MNNWDSIGYGAAALAWIYDDPKDVHRRIYEDTEASVDESTFNTLISGPYRSAVFRSADTLSAQLAFYRDRVVYVGLVSVLVLLGVDAFTAPFVVSAFALALLLFYLALHLLQSTQDPRAYLVVSLFSFAPFVAVPSTMATPDILCAVFVVASVHALATRKHAHFMGWALLATLTRADSILFYLAIGGAGLVWPRAFGWTRRHALSVMTAVSAAYIVLTNATGRASWWEVFSFTFVSMRPDWSSSTAPFEIGAYFRVLEEFFAPEQGIWLAVWIAFAVAALGRAPTRSFIGLTLLACTATCIARYFLMPRFWDWDRLYTPYFTVIFMLVIRRLWIAASPTPSRSS